MHAGSTRAVFLDRDGVINSDKDLYYVTHPDQFILNEGIGEFLRRLQDAGYLLIIITNQGGIAKGLYTHQTLEKIHRKMLHQLESYGVHITEIYYCPHHPDYGKCLCRKPESLLIEKALARFHINPDTSFFIGDRESDIQAAIKAGIKPVKTEPNENLMKYLPIFT
jgi:D-glycero-D-manno-heptose 1,7-bisphosphate phosphatase